jgi:stage V sporulation protein K
MSVNWKIVAGIAGAFVGGFAVGTQFPTEGAAKKKLSPKALKAASPAAAPSKKKSATDAPNDTTDSKNFIEKEMDQLIGMDDIRTQLGEVVAQIVWESERLGRGFDIDATSMHAILKGPPGTGKTVVARCLGRIFKRLGILSKGHFIEADRNDLVAGYIGQTAEKVRRLIARAKGGVLFIDEAYSLMGDEFASEAVAALIKGMEDNRDDLIVILAGYPDKMAEFLATNPGLQSRFPHQFEFAHYDHKTLCAIFDKELTKRELLITADARQLAQDHLRKIQADAGKSFGNGRYVRNFVENLVRKLSVRVAKKTGHGSGVSNEDLCTITRPDVAAAADQRNAPAVAS